MKVVAIHQPNFLPYPGFFYKMSLTEVFVLYDTAQFVRREYNNRNRIKTSRGSLWITVPVKVSGTIPIRAVRTDQGQGWRKRIWKAIQVNYGRAPHFARYAAPLRDAFFGADGEPLVDLNVRLVRLVREFLGLRARLRLASELPPVGSEDPTGKLVEITRAAGGDSYLSGARAMDYMYVGKFSDVTLRIARAPSREYPQLWGAFVPNLSVVDVLFNCGPETMRRLFADAAQSR